MNALIAAVFAVGGYLVKHYRLLGGDPAAPALPGVPVPPAAPGGFLAQLEAQLAIEAQLFIQQRLKAILPPIDPAPPK